MTLEVLEAGVRDAVALAGECADKCKAVLSKEGLASAIEYCNGQGIDPPQCSLTAKSPNADRLRNDAARKLTDREWWAKSLETKAVRAYERERISQGTVTDYVSDGVFAYMQKKKKR